MKIFCDRCDEELIYPGALVFSPPDGNQVIKYHLCILCWEIIENQI